jgi:hypothetical protein
MATETKRAILKIFAGFFLTSELKMNLDTSQEWNLLKILPKTDNHKLMITRFDGEDYLGIYLNSEKIEVQDLKSIHQELEKKVIALCPKLNPNKLQFKLFSQPLIP